MSSTLAKLNLRPQERRLLVGVATVVFIVLNIWLVWPHFKDWRQVKVKMSEAQRKLETYRAEVKRIPEYEARVQTLIGSESDVPQEDQGVQFLRTIQTQAAQSGLRINNNSRVSSRTNESFVEQTQTIGVQQTGEKQLVDFLHSLGSGNSMIRVRDLSLRPEPNRMLLGGSVTLVASYQRSTTSPKVVAATVPKPATPPVPALGKPANAVDHRMARTNRVATPPERALKPNEKPVTSTNKRP